MPRRALILSDACAYHVTNRSNNREWFYISIAKAWAVFCDLLTIASAKYETEIHAFVLMSNHYHLILATRQKNLDRFMRYFQTEVCRKIQRRSGRINHIFGTRYKWSVLWNSSSYAIATKYVLRNPAKAGITTSVENYPYSSVHPKALYRLPLLERVDPISNQIPKQMNERLNWLNTPTSKESDELVRKGLRRTEFMLSKGRERIIQQDLVSSRYGVTFEASHPLPFEEK